MSNFRNQEERNTVLLEGIYNGVTGKIDEMKTALAGNAAQQAAAYDAIAEGVRNGVEAIIREVRYLSQQNSAIYDSQVTSGSAKDALLAEIDRRFNDMTASLEKKFSTLELEARLTKRLELFADRIVESVEDIEDRLAESLEKYENKFLGQVQSLEARIAELKAEMENIELPVAVDYTETLDALTANVQALEARVEELKAQPAPTVDYDLINENVSKALDEEFDLTVAEAGIDAIATKVAQKLCENCSACAEEEEELLEGLEDDEEDLVLDVEEFAEKVAERIAAEPKEEVDYNALAQQVADLIVIEKDEIDYDVIAEKVFNRICDTCAEAEEGYEESDEEYEDDFDYDTLAQKIVERLEGKSLAAPEAAPVEEVVEEPAPVEEEAVEEPAPVEEEVVEEPAPVEEEAVEEPALVEEVVEEVPEEVTEELAVALEPAVLEYDEPISAEAAEVEMTTRLKKSFSAKIIESEEVIKEYYSILKNAMLSYADVTTQVNWSNDRFAYNNETIAKIGVRGRTLCVYLALNPEEFPESVYHQKFAGNTKMYERTPFMMKVKSGVALKRTLRLVEMLMERLGTVKNDEAVNVDYAAQYAYRSEEQLLAEGLIKTAIVEKSNLDF